MIINLKNIRYLFIILLFITNTNISAQNGKIKKLNKLLSKGKIEKCIKKGNRFKKKFPREPEIYFALTKAYLFSFNRETSINQKNNNLKKSLQNYQLAKRYIKDNSSDPLPYIKDTITNFAKQLHNSKHKRKSKYYYKFLVENYNDTLPGYWYFYSKNPKTENELTDNIIYPGRRKELISFAENLVGIPYVYGGETEKGFDCSGFTKYSFNSIGIELPHNANMQSQLGETIKLENAKPGDMIFFGYQNKKIYRVVHAGIIYSLSKDDIEIIHCVSRGVQIDDKESNNWQYYWKDKILFIKRLIED